MNLSTHALVGMTVGRLSKKPLLALVFGATSHAILDCLPHLDSWDPLLRVIDGTCTVAALTWAQSSPKPELEIAGAIGALLPDVENIPGYGAVTEPKKLFPSHWFRHETRSARCGIAVELLVLMTALAILSWPYPNRTRQIVP